MNKLLRYLNTKIDKSKSKLLHSFLNKRNLDKKTISQLQLGFSQFNSIPEFILKNKKHYIDLNVLNEDGYLKIKNRLAFPSFNANGDVINIGFKNLKNDKFPKMINTLIPKTTKPLFGLYFSWEYIKKYNQVIIVEGEIDFIALWKNGIRNVVALAGSSLSCDNISILLKFTNNFILALDNDKAGKDATISSFIKLMGRNVNIKVCNNYKYSDPDEYIESENIGAFSMELIHSIDIIDFVKQSELIDYTVKNIVNSCNRLNLINSVLEVLSQLKDNVYAEKLSLIKNNIKTFENAKEYCYLINPTKNELIDYVIAYFVLNSKDNGIRFPNVSWVKDHKVNKTKFKKLIRRIK
jgi:DNA primase